MLRLKGKGSPGIGGGPAGDALIEIHVRSHPAFERKGADIHVALPITLGEAVGGAKITVPTLTWLGDDDHPEELDHRRRAAAEGQGPAGRGGGPTGDQYVRLEVALPAAADPALEQAIRAGRRRIPTTRARR